MWNFILPLTKLLTTSLYQIDCFFTFDGMGKYNFDASGALESQSLLQQIDLRLPANNQRFIVAAIEPSIELPISCMNA